jgi:hypothetical protein
LTGSALGRAEGYPIRSLGMVDQYAAAETWTLCAMPQSSPLLR